MWSSLTLGSRSSYSSWLTRRSQRTRGEAKSDETAKQKGKEGRGQRYRAKVANPVSDASQSAQLVRSWLHQVAQDYERIQEQTGFLQEENNRLRCQLDQMEEELQSAQEHNKEMEVGDAVEARLLTPARLPPVRGSDYGGGAVKFTTWQDMVSLLDRKDLFGQQERRVNSRVHHSTVVSAFGDAMDPGDVVRYSYHSEEDDEDADGFEESPKNVFPVWFSHGVQGHESNLKIGNEAQQQVNQIDTELSLWFQQQDVRDDGNPLWYILSPVGLFRICWDLVWMVCLLFDVWLLSFSISFLSNAPCYFGGTYNCMSFYLIIDIALNFFTGIFNGNVIVWDPYLIAKSYLELWFWIDLIAAIPWATMACFALGGPRWMTNISDNDSRIIQLQLLRLLRFFRFFKMLFKLRDLTRHVGRTEGFGVYLLQPQRQDTVRVEAGAVTSFQDSIRKQLNHVLIMHSQHQSMPILVILFSCLAMHMQACIWGFLHYEWRNNDDAGMAFERYRHSLFWSYMTFFAGSSFLQQETLYYGLECIVALERSVVICLFGLWLIFQGLIMYDEDAHLILHKADALEYLQRRGVSVGLQSQVLSSFNETRRVRKLHHRFEELVDKQISYELRHMIFEELWGTRLKTLGLIGEMSQWHQDFLGRLSELVTEEAHASKAVLCRSGDWAAAAYYILEGVVHVISGLDADEIPDFTEGMWVGEKALVHTGFRRSNSIVTHIASILMVVPTQVFHDLINDLNLRERFQLFCTDELWRGLCGRCGRMGDHFSDECPTLSKAQRSVLRLSRSNESRRNSSQANTPISRELRMFLVDQGVLSLEKTLRGLGISTLEELETANLNVVAELEQESNGVTLTAKDLQKISPASIIKFRDFTRGAASSMLRPQDRRDQHFMFLSHYKLEAGTEASLMRFELEQMLGRNPAGPSGSMDVPVFLDSEDLDDLTDLQRRVRLSHNIVLILTQGVLTRPWVLVEIVTAVDAGIQILPVQIFKLGNVFEFPTEEFYVGLKSGQLLGDEGMQLIIDCGFTMDAVVSALHQTFQRIATPYSPHRPASIRISELEELLRLCRFRTHIPNVEPLPDLHTRSVNSDKITASNSTKNWRAPSEGNSATSSRLEKKKKDPFAVQGAQPPSKFSISATTSFRSNRGQDSVRHTDSLRSQTRRRDADADEQSPLLLNQAASSHSRRSK